MDTRFIVVLHARTPMVVSAQNHPMGHGVWSLASRKIFALRRFDGREISGSMKCDEEE